MIKMCDLPRYADADMEEIKKMKEAHVVLNQITYEPKPLYRGYTDKRLKIDVSDSSVSILDIPQEVKEKFTGGKGYCLRYLWDAVNPQTRWDSPENAVTMSAGPVAVIQIRHESQSLQFLQHFLAATRCHDQRSLFQEDRFLRSRCMRR